jgi:ketosteroid isomerase-like protein
MTYSLSRAAFADWLDRYRAAWEQRDPAAASALFSADASYHEMPYDPPIAGRAAIADYWAKAVAGQRDVRFTSEILACEVDRGLCHWHATFAAAEGGSTIDLDGVFHCRFAEAGQVAEFREWWHLKVTAAQSDG